MEAVPNTNIAQDSTHLSGGISAKRGNSHSIKNSTTVKRGIITSFNNTDYTADVLLLEATNTYLQNVPIAFHADGTSTQNGNLCAILFFDEQNYTDAVILAVFPNINQGAPTYPPGRVTFVPAYTFVNAVTINAGVTNTYTLSGSHNIPTNVLGALVQAYFTSAGAGEYVVFASHGGTNNGFTLGNLYTAAGFVNGCGIIQLSSDGKIDITANGGNCTITGTTYGYIF